MTDSAIAAAFAVSLRVVLVEYVATLTMSSCGADFSVTLCDKPGKIAAQLIDG
jgi:hypothetical protein